MADVRLRALRWLVAAWLASLAVAAGAVAQRAYAERLARGADVAVELAEVRALAGAQVGASVAELRAAGVTALAVRELALDALEPLGMGAVRSSHELARRLEEAGGGGLHPALRAAIREAGTPRTYVLLPAGPLARVVEARACALLGEASCRSRREDGWAVLELDVRPAEWPSVGLGLPPEDVELAARHGLGVVALWGPLTGARPAAAASSLGEASSRVPVRAVYLAGPAAAVSVTGAEALADWVRSAGAVWAAGPGVRGVDRLLERAGERLAGVAVLEAGRLAALQGRAAEGFVSSQLRQGARVFLVRAPAAGTREERLRALAGAVRAVASALHRRGYRLGRAEPPGPPAPAWAVPAAGVGVAAMGALLLARVVALPGIALAGLGLVAALVLLLPAGLRWPVAGPAVALPAVVLAPAWATDLWLVRWAGRDRRGRAGTGASPIAALWPAAGDALATAAVVLAASLPAAAAVADTAHAAGLKPLPDGALLRWLPAGVALGAYAVRRAAGWPERPGLRAMAPSELVRCLARACRRAWGMRHSPVTAGSALAFWVALAATCLPLAEGTVPRSALVALAPAAVVVAGASSPRGPGAMAACAVAAAGWAAAARAAYRAGASLAAAAGEAAAGLLAGFAAGTLALAGGALVSAVCRRARWRWADPAAGREKG